MAGRCDCAQTCACALGGSDSVSMSGSGAVAQPYVPALRRMPGTENAVKVFSNGVAVYMLVKDSNGTPLEVESDGYVTVPAGGDPDAPPPEWTLGDGLSDEAGLVVPDVTDDSAWPLQDLSGSNLAGSAANFDAFMGKLVRAPSGLYAMPDHTVAQAGAGETIEGAQLTPVATTFTSASGIQHQLVNPSTSRRMLVFQSLAVTADIASPVGGKASVQLQRSLQSGAYVAQRTLNWPVPTSGVQSVQFDGEISKDDVVTLGPGGTLQVRVRVVVTKVGTGPDNPVFMGASGAVKLFGVTI